MNKAGEHFIDPNSDPVADLHSNYILARSQYWNDFYSEGERWSPGRRFYQSRLTDIYKLLIPPHSTVLELGCGHGDLLASLTPSRGRGCDLSSVAVAAATNKYPHLCFTHGDMSVLDIGETFDYVVLSDLVNELWDVQTVLTRLTNVCHPGTRVIFNFYSHFWQIPRRMAELSKIARPQLTQNWLTSQDLRNLLYVCGFETIRSWQEILCPFDIPLFADVLNRYVVHMWPLNHLGITNMLVARPAPVARPDARVTVVVPARNEEGNIEAIFRRVPEIGASTELIFVEGNSLDNTFEKIEAELARTRRPLTKLLKQTGNGKGNAVREGFALASGDLLFILDADLTVAPEDLPSFYAAWKSGRGDFINGVRLAYPMEDRAMRFLNLLGNKFFSNTFSWLLGQPIKDTLCGTKVLSRADYQKIAQQRDYFGDFDPFGDFDLIFGAAKCNLRIVDLPIRYRERTYGETNIRRWKHGWLLIKMVFFAMRRIKFV